MIRVDAVGLLPATEADWSKRGAAASSDRSRRRG